MDAGHKMRACGDPDDLQVWRCVEIWEDAHKKQAKRDIVDESTGLYRLWSQSDGAWSVPKCPEGG